MKHSRWLARKLGGLGITFFIVFGLFGAAIATGIIVSSFLLKEKSTFKTGLTLLIIFSAIGLVTIQGLYGLGPLISLLGALSTKIKR